MAFNNFFCVFSVTEFYTAATHGFTDPDVLLTGFDDGGGWFHMLPPDRMHLFNEGMWRHFLGWILDLVDAWRPYCRASNVPLIKQKSLEAKQKMQESEKTDTQETQSKQNKNQSKRKRQGKKGNGF